MKHPLDDHLKKQLGHYEPEVPPHIWENILAQKDKKRPAGFLFFLQQHGLKLLLIGLLLISGSVYLLNKNDKNHSATPQSTLAISSDNKAQSHQTNANHTQTNPITEIKHTTSTTLLNNTNVSNNLNNVRTENKNILSEANKKRASDFNIDSRNSTPISDFIAKEKNRSRYTKGGSSMNSEGSASVMNPLADDPFLPSEEEAENTLVPQWLSLSNASIHKKELPSLKEKKLYWFSIPCPRAEKNAAGNKDYIEIYAGPDLAFRTYSDTGNSAYLNKRKESTQLSGAFSAGVRYTRVFNNAMSVRVGINYSQVNERFEYVQGNIIQTVYVLDASGDTTSSYSTSSTRYKKTHNKFRTLDIPIMVGYEMGNGRLHTNLNAGVVVNVYSWFKGDVLDKSLQPINVNTGTPSSPYQYKTNIGLGFMGALSVYYKLNDRLHLLAEPYYRYNFSSASKSELTFKQKNNAAGLRLGVRVDF